MRSRTKNKGLALFACIGSALVGGNLLMLWASWPTQRVVAQWTQPESVRYGPFGPHVLTVVDRGPDYSSMPWGHAHEIWISLHDEEPRYGYRAPFGFHPGSSTMDYHIQQSTVTWTEAGVTFAEPGGTQIMIPIAAFNRPK